MSENSHQEMLDKFNKTQMELKIRLEQVSKLRIDCARMQLELLKLYKPQCLEILESLRVVSEPAEDPSGDDDIAIESQISHEKVYIYVEIYLLHFEYIGLTHRLFFLFLFRNAVYNVNRLKTLPDENVPKGSETTERKTNLISNFFQTLARRERRKILG